MKRVLIQFSIATVFLLQSLIVFADNKCIQEALNRAVNPVPYQKVWTLDQPVTTVVNDEVLPITYSFDSEISYADGLLVLSEKQEWIDELNTMIAKIDISENKLPLKDKLLKLFGRSIDGTKKIDLMKLPIEDIAKADGRSVKQFLAFGGLRKGVPKDKKFYAITDLNPVSYDLYMNTVVRSIMERRKLKDTPHLFNVNETNATTFIDEYRSLMEKVLVDEKKLPVKVTKDAAYIELPHKSFEQTPKGLRDTVEGRLHEMFKWRSTHLHIGLPGGISEDTMGSIARAVEARVILEMAYSSPRASSELYATSYSTLRSPPKNSKKNAGVVRLNYRRHKEPFPMHDLEVRNYLKLKEGLNHIALASRMGEEHKRVLSFQDFRAASISDPYTSNLNGALKYVGTVAKHKGNNEVGDRLLELATRIESEGKITESMRKEVHEYLREIDILNLMEPNFFLD